MVLQYITVQQYLYGMPTLTAIEAGEVPTDSQLACARSWIAIMGCHHGISTRRYH
jgi:hypothetical protein